MSSTETISFYFAASGPHAFTDKDWGFVMFKTEAGLSLDELFYRQGNNPSGSKIVKDGYSLSAGDIIERGGKMYLIDRLGFRELSMNDFNTWKATPSRDRSWDFLTPLQSRI